MTTTLNNFVAKISNVRRVNDQSTGKVVSEVTTRQSFELPSVAALTHAINNREQPFDVIDKEGQYHLIPTSKGLYVVIPDENDYLYRLTHAEFLRKQEAGDQSKPDEFKRFGNFTHKWCISWEKVNVYLRTIQKEAIEFFNILSTTTRSQKFGRTSRLEFDRIETNTLTRQLRFLVSSMLIQNFKPPIIIYGFSLEFYPAMVYRQCLPYQNGDVNSYKAATVQSLYQTFSHDYLYNDDEIADKGTTADPNYQQLNGVRYFNYSTLDKSSWMTGGSMQITKEIRLDNTAKPETSTYEAVDF